jgi:FPC/CPF motif-containing protein YcgG
VSTNPDDRNFSFSFGGTALFVVGMHPKSSRLTQRFIVPALVFNPHYQFEMLRSRNEFDRFAAVIRARELALRGSLNPNLDPSRQRSEARQYSGRAVEENWRCPFRA